ncbi:MAG: alpha/beta fold hydrolase [Labilithrix sp.]|nr:alpha/beta fold hydrolase [Labilithrix sp.]MCW5814911.1 alpha/beta fold hydrolase [Labilithrix sp.]
MPQAHADPAGPKLGLRVMRARGGEPGRARGGEPGRAPVVFLQGGPGGTVRSFAQGGFAERYARLFERDVILLEQRGNALSSPALDCGINPANPASEAAFRACTEKYAREGVRIEGFNTIESAHDVDAVRRALGVPKVLLWGGSYGAYLAATVARLHPESVEALLLESPALTGRPYRAFDQFRRRGAKVDAFNAWLKDACAANPTCAERYPAFDPAAEIGKLVESAKTMPVVLADGVLVDSEETMRAALTGALYFVPNAVLLVRAVWHANRGELDAFLDGTTVRGRPARAYLGRAVSVDGIAYTTSNVVNCYDLTRNWTREGLEAATEGLFEPDARVDVVEAYGELRRTCDALPAPTVPQEELAVPVSTAIPTLFLAGDLDHPTPVEDVIADQPRFSRSQLVRFTCSGHGIEQSARDCFGSLVTRFFADPGAPLDPQCAIDRCSSSDLGATTDLFIELR